MYPTIIKNNFFHNPDDIVENTKKIKWYKSSSNDNWPGYRSDNIYNFNMSLHDLIVHDILKLYFRNENIVVGETKIQFHKINYNDWLEHNRKNTKIHKDSSELAGVIYLNKDTNNFNTGTSFYDENKNITAQISNNYNTLACYDGKIYHGATSLDYDERLIIVIFLNKIKKVKLCQ